ncbi:MAG: hypothetical protein EAZ89_01495 [Bacteroidetes bacterium]|nr:MAG: hypothetical protein EAZ89_01495 [Bacteroidota bacterium]
MRMSGLHTLRVKETDRIEALRTELGKFGVQMSVEGDTATITGKSRPSEHSVETYEDHRMAMAFAPMALLQPQLLIRHHEVVEKSYPSFWQHVEQANIRLTEW